MTDQYDPTQASVAGLRVAEQFVLWALWTRLEGTAKRAHLEKGFRLAGDEASGAASLAAFESWFEVLAGHCRRDLHLHRARCPCVSGDECAMLDLAASAQAGDEIRLYRGAAVLVHPGAIALLQGSSRALAAALCRLGLHLSHRPAWTGRGIPVRLH